MPLTFLPINLEEDLEQAWAFRTERIATDFDPASLKWNTPADYAKWLATKQAWNPLGASHVWENGQIIGQIECDIARLSPTAGYVNFYYLVSSHRNRGLGSQLVAFTETLFRNAGMQTIQLSTTPANQAAQAFYRKNGFIERGPRPDNPTLILLEKKL